MTNFTNLISKIAFGIALAAGTLAATTSASAQTSALRVNIPFSFTADKVAIPAGHYIVSTESRAFLSFYNTDTGVTRNVMMREEIGATNEGASRLTFTNQPGGIYLSQVWTGGSASHIELTSHPKAEREIAAGEKYSTFDISTK